MKETMLEAIDEIQGILTIVSGATPYQLRTSAYYAALSWHQDQFNTLAYLVYHGRSGRGKSRLMQTTGYFCFSPVTLNVSTTTQPVIRNRIAQLKGKPRTVILEEFGDDSQIHALLLGRYQRTTATAGKMEKDARGNWREVEFKTFGSTLIHRLEHFRQDTLENRSIYLYIPYNPGDYVEPEEVTKFVPDVVHRLKDTASIEIPRCQRPKLVPRVVDTYEPILMLATFLADEKYVEEVMKEMKQADAIFRDGLSYDPKVASLRGLISQITDASGTLDLKRSVKIVDIRAHIQANSQKGLGEKEVIRYLRNDLKFEVRISGGNSKVMNVTVPHLARACLECGIREDSLIREIDRIRPKERADFECEE